jgi:hypothetical protein
LWRLYSTDARYSLLLSRNSPTLDWLGRRRARRRQPGNYRVHCLQARPRCQSQHRQGVGGGRIGRPQLVASFFSSASISSNKSLTSIRAPWCRGRDSGKVLLSFRGRLSPPDLPRSVAGLFRCGGRPLRFRRCDGTAKLRATQRKVLARARPTGPPAIRRMSSQRPTADPGRPLRFCCEPLSPIVVGCLLIVAPYPPWPPMCRGLAEKRRASVTPSSRPPRFSGPHLEFSLRI